MSFTVETRKAVEVFLMDPTSNVEIAVRNQILHLAKTSPADLFKLHEELVAEWGKMPPKWPEEDARRAQVLSVIIGTIDNEKLCHMCQLGRFVHVNTVGEGTNMEVRHYRCTNPACGSCDTKIMHPA